MNTDNSRALREGAMMVALTAVFILLYRFVPFFSLIGLFICGVPMASFSVRNGLTALIPALIAAFLISALISGGFLTALSIMLISVIPGAVAGYMMGKKSPFFTVLFSTCLCVCIGWLFELTLLEIFAGNGIDEMFSEIMKQVESTFSQLTAQLGEGTLQKAGIKPEEFSAAFIETFEYTIRLYFPSVIVITAMLSGYIIIRMSAFIIKRCKLKNVDIPPFSMLKAPRSLGTVTVILYLVMLFTGRQSVSWPVISNAVMVLYTILAFCGLSFVDYNFKKKVKSAVLRALIYACIFFAGSMLISIIVDVLIIISLFDSTRDFRKIDYHGDNA